MEKREIPASSILVLSEDDVRYANVISTRMHEIANELHKMVTVTGTPKEFADKLKEVLKIKTEIDAYFETLIKDLEQI